MGEKLTVAEVLRRARVQLAENGWCQGEYVDGHGRRCMVGAIMEVVEPWTPVFRKVERALEEVLPEPEDVPAFNDTPGRTYAEVDAAFEKAIALAEKEG
jgi:hypothetical protein